MASTSSSRATTATKTDDSLYQPAPSARTLRLRATKRLQRARQKAHTEDLERQVRDLKRQGVQATIEMQIAARKVSEENRRLRRLVARLVGREDVVEELLDEMEKEEGNGPSPCLGIGGGACTNTKTIRGRPCRRETDAFLDAAERAHHAPTGQADERTACAEPSTPMRKCKRVGGEAACLSAMDTKDNVAANNLATGSSSPATEHPTPPPCKLLTHLSLNPRADVTQLLPPTATDDAIPTSHPASTVPCATAYNLLMHHAGHTEGPRLDAIAKILEDGCVPGKEGCGVKSEAVWGALDGLCL